VSNHTFVLCIGNRGYGASLEPCKVYRAMSDPAAEKHAMVRVVDESSEDYLFPRQAVRPHRSAASCGESLPGIAPDRSRPAAPIAGRCAPARSSPGVSACGGVATRSSTSKTSTHGPVATQHQSDNHTGRRRGDRLRRRPRRPGTPRSWLRNPAARPKAVCAAAPPEPDKTDLGQRSAGGYLSVARPAHREARRRRGGGVPSPIGSKR
jgi:hypothetical protein